MKLRLMLTSTLMRNYLALSFRPPSRNVRTKIIRPAGYQFGDISRSLGSKIANSINNITGKDEYQFGDLTLWLDKAAKSKAASLTGKDEYEFGDLSRWVDSKVKDKVNDITGKDTYTFGDLTKEIASRVTSGKYTYDDLILLLKVLLKFGVGLSPVAGILPVRLLVELLNYSIAEEAGNRLIGALAQEIDRRVKLALVGDSNYKMGDLTMRAVNGFTGKDEYKFGDITRKVMNELEDYQARKAISIENGEDIVESDMYLFTSNDHPKISKLDDDGERQPLSQVLDASILADLERWDKVFTERTIEESEDIAI